MTYRAMARFVSYLVGGGALGYGAIGAVSSLWDNRLPDVFAASFLAVTGLLLWWCTSQVCMGQCSVERE